MHVRVREKGGQLEQREHFRHETRAGRSWRGPAAAVETWKEESVLRTHTESTRLLRSSAWSGDLCYSAHQSIYI